MHTYIIINSAQQSFKRAVCIFRDGKRVGFLEMEKELVDFVRENGLSAFSKFKTPLRSPNNTVFKTKDAKAIHAKVLNDVSRNFVFKDTPNLLLAYAFTLDENELRRRQDFFKTIALGMDNDFLKGLEIGRGSWKPPYGIVVVTEDDKTFMQLQKNGCPVKILLNETDVLELENSDIVQVIDCEQYSRALERLPQSVFLNFVDEAYLERHVELLSSWENVIRVLSDNELGGETGRMVSEISDLLPLLEKNVVKKITRERVEEALEEIREEVGKKVVEMTISGVSLMEIINKGIIPEELKEITNNAIDRTSLPRELFFRAIPVGIDETELEKIIRNQDISEFTGVAEKIKSKSKNLISLPEKLERLSERLLLYDFKAGISKWMSGKTHFPSVGENFSLEEASNLFLDNPQPISFNFSDEYRCSILTGANSGGKTTLLEHILQAISCMQLGLPFAGKFVCPMFSEVYYFAKNTGSMSKGAFENLLMQMSRINPGNRTLILADEIEAVTEPGVAGKMIGATATYFIEKGCYLVIATHLGHEIQKAIPEFARIDGIEAKGLSNENELIVDHNPVLGRLAHSTPELIIEKMAKTMGGSYFEFLHRFL